MKHNRIPRVIIYRRCATMDDTALDNLDRQLRVCSEGCDARFEPDGWRQIDICDPGIPGTYAGQDPDDLVAARYPGMYRALCMLRRRDADYLMVSEADRLMRDVVGSSKLLKKYGDSILLAGIPEIGMQKLRLMAHVLP